MRGAPLLVVALAAGTLACDDCDENIPRVGARSGSLPPPAPAAAAPRAVATPASFDLVATGSGALLAWGAPAETGGAVSLLALDSLGGERGRPRTLFERRTGAPTSALEIAAASGGGRVGVAWVSRAGDALTVLATHGSDEAEAFAPPIDLGPVSLDGSAGGATGAPSGTTSRGALAASAAEDGNVAVLHRQMPGECPPGGEAPSATDGRCVYFGVERLGGSPGGTERRGVGLAAPDPCPRSVVGYVWSAGVWYYGICTAAGDERSPVTTVYAIQFDPEYAHAERVLEGCDPIGLGASRRGVVAIGRCSGRFDAVELRDAARERAELSGVERSVVCSEGRPKITLRDAQGASIERVLGGPESGIEVLLPDAVAAPGSRAAWTGDALLVATAEGGSVSLRRHRCEGDVLVELPSAAGMMR